MLGNGHIPIALVSNLTDGCTFWPMRIIIGNSVDIPSGSGIEVLGNYSEKRFLLDSFQLDIRLDCS